MNRLRRRLLIATSALPLVRAAGAQIDYPSIVARPLAFPRDFGAHPAFRTEWWYLTGVLDPPPQSRGAQQPLGVQLTFFRIRTPVDPANPSRFAAHQLVLAHAALADPRRGVLLHEERLARTGFGVAWASEHDTDVTIEGWQLRRDAATGVYHGAARAASFAIDMTAAPTQPALLQGNRGYSIKAAPAGADTPASLYYSEPQLALQAKVSFDDKPSDASSVNSAVNGAVHSGRGWLDHEWSSTLLPQQASGWDWLGFNLYDGSALTAFRIRCRDTGRADPSCFAYASLRAPARPMRTFGADEVAFEPLQLWKSPRSGASYPVAQGLRVGARRFETRPLMQDQELDSSAGGGIVYWEGASRLYENGREVGRGYLELTGYAGAPLGADHR